VLAGTLSRAYAPADLTDESTQFTEELATLMDEEQLQELLAVASQRTLDAIYAAPSADDEYKKLKHQIVGGWPAAPDAVPAAGMFTRATGWSSPAGLGTTSSTVYTRATSASTAVSGAHERPCFSPA